LDFADINLKVGDITTKYSVGDKMQIEGKNVYVVYSGELPSSISSGKNRFVVLINTSDINFANKTDSLKSSISKYVKSYKGNNLDRKSVV